MEARNPSSAAEPVSRVRSKRRWLLGAVMFTGVLAVTAVAVGLNRQRAAAAPSTHPTYRVQRGRLTISVTESGSVSALDQIDIISEVEGQTTILELVEEGRLVEKGDLLVALDASRLNDNLVEQQIRVHNAEASFIRARENMEVTRNQTEADISDAELKLQFAREDRVKYEKGDYPKQLMELESRITLAHEELEQATQTLGWSQALFDEQYISKSELERDRLARQRAELDLTLAQANLDLFRDYTHQRQLDQLRNDEEQAVMALERTRLRANADIVQAAADLRAREAEYSRQQDRLARIEDQLEKTRIYAPRSGMVVYATTGQSRWRSGEPLEEGQQVRERQTLIHLPSPGRMRVEVQVHESALEMIERGQPARVTLDALPGRVYSGRIVRIAPLPDASMRWMNPDLKVYSTQINLDGETVGLRTGMSCRAEILIEEHENVLAVPIQSVIRVNGRPTVYVKSGRDFEPRTIDIGLDNNRMVHVLDGLVEGEIISLTPPLQDGASPMLRAPAAAQDDVPETAAHPTPPPVTGNGDDDGERRQATAPDGERRPRGSGREQGSDR